MTATVRIEAIDISSGDMLVTGRMIRRVGDVSTVEIDGGWMLQVRIADTSITRTFRFDETVEIAH